MTVVKRIAPTALPPKNRIEYLAMTAFFGFSQEGGFFVLAEEDMWLAVMPSLRSGKTGRISCVLPARGQTATCLGRVTEEDLL